MEALKDPADDFNVRDPRKLYGHPRAGWGQEELREDRNATAVVERGIQTLKKDLASRPGRPMERPLQAGRGLQRPGRTRPSTWHPKKKRSNRPQNCVYKTKPTSSSTTGS